MKKFTTLLLILLMSFAAASVAVGEGDTRIFTDSTGREVTVPRSITRVAVTGPMTQHVVFALAPDMLVGVSDAWSEEEKEFIPQEYWSLPDIGQLYGGKGTMNLEALLAAEPQIVLDIGESKKGIGDDMEQLTLQTGIPFIHIDAELFTFHEAFIALGDLLGCPDMARELADFCSRTCLAAQQTADKAEKVRLLYIVGEEGLGVIAKGSYQASVIDLMSDNIAVVENPSARGTGNEVDMEQLLLWDPECIIFGTGSVYDQVAEDPLWQNLTAVKNGRYYESPCGPYNWMGFPPACQRMVGLLWMGKLLYPEAADYDLYEEAKTYFNLFYHTQLPEERFNELVKHSIGKTLK